MNIPLARSPASPLTDPVFRRFLWIVVGGVGWLGLLALGAMLFMQTPPRAGFDLALILDAGRRVAAGGPVYLAGAVSTGTQVESLFYSYPPPVAQLASLAAAVPDVAVLLGIGAISVAGFVAVAARLRSRIAPDGPSVAGPVLALAPFGYPFAVALLFGNIDATFPFVYGAVIAAVVAGSGRWRLAGGLLLGLATVAKLYPGLLLLWLLVRGLRMRGGPGARLIPGEWRILFFAMATIVASVAASVAVGGLGPWQDYVDVVRSGAGATFASALNIGPASQIALLTGDPEVAARVAPLVALVAILLAALAAWVVRGAALSLTIAATASLFILPITWFHYPVALLPFAAWAWIAAPPGRGRTAVALLVAAAILVAGGAVAAPVVVWVAVACVIGAVLVATSARARLGSGGLADLL